MKEKDDYLRAIAERNKIIRKLVAAGKSKAAVARLHNLSRERVRQIVGAKQ